MSLQWPLTGRADEMTLIDEALAGGGAILAGAAGVGKTRLAHETIAAGKARGMLTWWIGASTTAQELPLGAFAGIVDVVDTAPLRVVRATMDALTRGRPRYEILIVFDDAHLLDPMSAFLLHQLVVQELATVVVTVRTGEHMADAVTGLWKDGHLQRIEIEPLSKHDIGDLVAEILGSVVDSSTTHRLWALTLGNALFLRQLIEDQVAAKRILQADGVWHWRDDMTLSRSLADLVGLRIGALPDRVGEVVDMLAVAEPLDADVLARLVDTAALELAEASGLITIESSGAGLRAKLAHTMYGEVRRSYFGTVRARRLRGKVASSMAGSSRTPDDRLRLAALALESDYRADPELYVAAAQTAMNLLDLPLAERLAREAVEAGGGFDARYTHSVALLHLGAAQDAESALAQLDSTILSSRQRVQVAASRMLAAVHVGDLDRAAAVLDEAESDDLPPEGRATMSACRAAVQALSCEPEKALRSASEALEFEEITDVSAMGALWATYMAAAVLGRVGPVDNAGLRVYDIANTSFESAFQLYGDASAHVYALRMIGRPYEGLRIAELVRNASADVPGPAQLLAELVSAEAHFGVGELRETRRHEENVLAGIRAGQVSPVYTMFVLLHLTYVACLSGRADEAARLFGELETSVVGSYARAVQAQLLTAHAWVQAASGEIAAACVTARAAAQKASELHQPAEQLLALHTVIRLGDPGSADEIVAVAAVVEGRWAPAVALHAAGLAARDGTLLESAATAFERIGDRISAVDAAAQASVVFAECGDTAAAVAAATRARKLALDCGADTPALRAAVAPTPLTEREREVAALAAQGFSNRAIADKLTVSIRTVEGHLYRINAKLGHVQRTALNDHIADS